MELINDTLRHFFLKEYADIEPNKFVHLCQTGYQFDESMFISPATENGKPFFSEAIASEFLSDICDQIIPLPGSVNPQTLTSSLSDKYRSIIEYMRCAQTDLAVSFSALQSRAKSTFKDIDPFHIESTLNTISYKPFKTNPVSWHADNGWQDPPYTQQFNFKKQPARQTSSGTALVRPMWKQSPALSALLMKTKPLLKQRQIPAKVDSVVLRAAPSLNKQKVFPDKTITADDRKNAKNFFNASFAGRLLTDQRAIINQTESIISKPLETNSLTVQFFYKVLPVTIPWLQMELFGDIENFWYLPGMEVAELSTGENKPTNTGSMPSYISDIIIVKDVKISGRFSDKEIEEINGAFGFEAFNLTDKQIPARQPDGTVLVESRGQQILGFLCTVFPKCPSFPGPA